MRHVRKLEFPIRIQTTNHKFAPIELNYSIFGLVRNCMIRLFRLTVCPVSTFVCVAVQLVSVLARLRACHVNSVHVRPLSRRIRCPQGLYCCVFTVGPEQGAQCPIKSFSHFLVLSQFTHTYSSFFIEFIHIPLVSLFSVFLLNLSSVS